MIRLGFNLVIKIWSLLYLSAGNIFKISFLDEDMIVDYSCSLSNINKTIKIATKNPKKHINKLLFIDESKERVIADFIAGMTDRYAINLHNKIR